MALIELKDVQVAYGRRKALRGVTGQIHRGAVGLLGPNGAGKSTLMKTMLGFIRPQAGSVTLFGKPMPEESLAVRHQLGYMPERDLMSPRVSAVSFLTYCGCIFGMMRADAMERAHAVLNYVGMGETRYRKMETYSKGMCQRVKLAQGLIHDPKLLLLDEPTNGLDPDGRIEILNLIRELAHQRGVTVVLSTHLLPDVEYVCDKVLIIHQGRVVRHADLDEITAAREGVVEVKVPHSRDGFVEALDRLGCTWRDQQDGTILVSKPATIANRALFEAARDQGTQIRHFRPVRQRLEEVFMEAIGKKTN